MCLPLIRQYHTQYTRGRCVACCVRVFPHCIALCLCVGVCFNVWLMLSACHDMCVCVHLCLPFTRQYHKYQTYGRCVACCACVFPHCIALCLCVGVCVDVC